MPKARLVNPGMEKTFEKLVEKKNRGERWVQAI
jgi:hypothetical protein